MGVMWGHFVALQVRDLKVRDSEAVVRWGGLLLSKHAAALSFEECERPRACRLALPPNPHRVLPVSAVPRVQQLGAAAPMRRWGIRHSELHHKLLDVYSRGAGAGGTR